MDKFLESHVAARLISIVLAFFLWLFVVNEQNPEIDRTVVVVPEIRGMPADLVLVEEVQPVSVRLRGRRDDIVAITADDLELYVNMSEAVEGENNPEVSLASMPAGIQVLEIIPPHLQIQTEQIIQEQLELQLSLTGEPAQGYALGEQVLNPSQVLAEGPRSQVERIARAIVQIDVTEAAADIRTVVPVSVVDRQGNALQEDLAIRPEVVELIIPVEKLPSKNLPIEPQIVGMPAEGYKVEGVIVEPSTLEVYGPQEVLDRLDRLETASLDISEAAFDIYQELPLLVPEDVQAPQRWVRVTVRISQVTQEKRLQVPVRVHNLEEGLAAAQVQPETVAVTLSGPYTAVNALPPREVIASVDAAGLKEGEHRLNVRVSLPSGIEEVALEPEEVVVVIAEAEEDQLEEEED